MSYPKDFNTSFQREERLHQYSSNLQPMILLIYRSYGNHLQDAQGVIFLNLSPYIQIGEKKLQVNLVYIPSYTILVDYLIFSWLTRLISPSISYNTTYFLLPRKNLFSLVFSSWLPKENTSSLSQGCQSISKNWKKFLMHPCTSAPSWPKNCPTNHHCEWDDVLLPSQVSKMSPPCSSFFHQTWHL